jgi:DNA-binding response OmpR family regulator
VLKILLLVDKEFPRADLVHFLESHVCDVHTVTDAQEFKQQVTAIEFDLLLVDTFIKSTDTLFLIEEFRRQFPNSRIVAFVAANSFEARVRAYEAGADQIIEMPINLDLVLAVIYSFRRGLLDLPLQKL